MDLAPPAAMRHLVSVLCLFAFSSPVWAGAEGESHCEILVIKTKPEMEGRFNELVNIFKTRGTSAVTEAINADTLDPKSLQKWQEFAAGEKVHVLEVKVHPNQAAAVAWLNKRFARMGIPNLQLKAEYDESAPDPTAIDADRIKGKKWLRYLAGPGVAVAAFFLGLPAHEVSVDYLYLIIPAAGVGVTTVALELQFAWPWLNNVFWKKVWKFGGAVGGRLTNLMINFLYGMALYGADVGSRAVPMLFGGQGSEPTLDFTQAVFAAAWGAVTFHLAMGQYQTDIAREEERGSITAEKRYGLETNGVVVNNSARVASWIFPGGTFYGTMAQAGFFLIKTFPQLLKTDVNDVIDDREIHRRVNPAAAPKKTLAESCGRILGTYARIPFLKPR